MTQRGDARLGHVSERVKRSTGIYVREVTIRRKQLFVYPAGLDRVRAIRNPEEFCNALRGPRNIDAGLRGQLAIFSRAFRGGGFRCAVFGLPTRMPQALRERAVRELTQEDEARQ